MDLSMPFRDESKRTKFKPRLAKFSRDGEVHNVSNNITEVTDVVTQEETIKTCHEK